MNEYGGAWKMFSLHPVNESASLQLPYKELPENANRILAPQLSSDLYHTFLSALRLSFSFRFRMLESVIGSLWGSSHFNVEEKEGPITFQPKVRRRMF